VVTPAAGSASPSGLTPNQVRGAYGLGTYGAGGISGGISFGGTAGDGAGMTIAIVDAYDYPSALSDVNAFSAQYNLPQFNVSGGPTFQKLNQTGGTSLPSASGNSGWSIEEALDIDWAHSMAPKANIILFEASDTGNGLYTAVQTAAATSGVVVISMSWSGAEYSSETLDDSGTFSTPSGHPGVTFLSATGDSGAYAQNSSTVTPQYPAASKNVVAVGGTTLGVSGNAWSSETVWGSGTNSGSNNAGGSGGGISAYESQPSWQTSLAGVSNYSTTKRVYPDIAADANPYSGVPIYDTYDFGASTPWAQYGGTSLACPLWAGMIAVADQGRAIAHLSSLDGASQTLPMLYQMSSSNFHDITTGGSLSQNQSSTGPVPYNSTPGFVAASGYDMTSGRGAPLANLVIPQLVGGTQLVFGQQPTSTSTTTAISPAITVLIEDSLGNVVSSDNSTVTLSFGNNPGGGNLSGTLTVAAVHGVATFSNLSINSPGNGYTLVATDTIGTNVLTVTSAAFSVSSPVTVATPAAAAANAIGSTSTTLSVLGAADAGESTLTYTWSATTLPSGAAAPSFSPNGTNAAKNTTVTFSKAGTYVLTATISNGSGGTAASSVTVTVNSTFTSLGISPSSLTLSAKTQSSLANLFTVSGLDQFGNSISNPASLAWSATNGAVTSTASYTPPPAAGTDTVTVTSGGYQASATVNVVSPLGWWKFNEGSGTAVNDSGTGTADNGTIGTSGNWLSAANGTNGTPALQFSAAASSLVSLGNPSKLSFTGQITLSAWVKPSSTSSAQYIIDHRTSTSNDVFLMINSSGQYQVGVSSGGTLHTAVFAIPSGDVGNWVHLAGTYDGTAWRLYRNGVLVNSTNSTTGVISITTGNWGIGGAASGSNNKRYFSGAIDDVRIYNSAISSSAIGGLMAMPPTVATAASATPSIVTGTTTALSALGADDAGQGSLSYAWATIGTPPAPVVFSANGTNAAQNTTATFTVAGVYNLAATITNVAGLTATSIVTVTVNQTLTSIAVQASPLLADGTMTMSAIASDQFGNAMTTQPPFTWSVVGGGAVTADGVFTPAYTTGSATVTATSGAVSGKSIVSLPGAAQWISGGGTSWNAAGTWNSSSTSSAVAAPGTRTVAGDNAVFTNVTGGTVTLDGASPSLAALTFGDAGGYTIAQGSGGALHLSNGSAAATVTVVDGTQTISAPVVLDSNVTFSAAANTVLTVSGPITVNGHTITVIGPGKVIFSGLGGGSPGTIGLDSTTVGSGKLVIQSPSMLMDGSSLTVGDASFFSAGPTVAATVGVPASTAASTASSTSASATPTSSKATIASAAPPVAVYQGGPSLPLWLKPHRQPTAVEAFFAKFGR
jgi:hypothetical protein